VKAVGVNVGSGVGRGPLAVASPKDVGYSAAATSKGGLVGKTVGDAVFVGVSVGDDALDCGAGWTLITTESSPGEDAWLSPRADTLCCTTLEAPEARLIAGFAFL
jgi:hypothetical protein